MQSIPFKYKRGVEAVLQPLGDFHEFRVTAHHRNQDSKLVATEPSQHVVGAQLLLHTQRNLTQIHVPYEMSIDVVDLLKLVEIDVDQTKDPSPLARLSDLRVQIPFQGEPIVYLGEKVELRSVLQIGVQPPRFNGQSGLSCSSRKGLRLLIAGFRQRIEGGTNRSERRSGAARNLLVDN